MYTALYTAPHHTFIQTGGKGSRIDWRLGVYPGLPSPLIVDLRGSLGLCGRFWLYMDKRV